MISELHFNQWENTNSVLKWFTDISNTNDYSFKIQLDIRKFYPSKNKDILTNAIQFTKMHAIVDDKDLHLTMHCWKSLLCYNETWKKKSTAESCFDVTMGSFDGAKHYDWVNYMWDLGSLKELNFTITKFCEFFYFHFDKISSHKNYLIPWI